VVEGHPTPSNPWVKVATGSLGQGLAAANGIALANRLDGIDARVFCLLGDGECSEGSVWEAAQFGSLNGLSSLVAIVDVNGLGQSDWTPYRHDTGVLARRFSAFGWRTIEIDGHDTAAGTGRFNLARGTAGALVSVAGSMSTLATGFLFRVLGASGAFPSLLSWRALPRHLFGSSCQTGLRNRASSDQLRRSKPDSIALRARHPPGGTQHDSMTIKAALTPVRAADR